jgi:hypothetical protein
LQRKQQESDNKNKRLLELSKETFDFKSMMENNLNVIQAIDDAQTKKLNDTLAELAALQLKLDGYENKLITNRSRNIAFAATFMVFGFLDWLSFWAFRDLPWYVLGAWTLLPSISASQ